MKIMVQSQTRMHEEFEHDIVEVEEFGSHGKFLVEKDTPM